MKEEMTARLETRLDVNNERIVARMDFQLE
jgi:hypothetical protein